MGRPVYPYELVDPDFSWLITNFQENFPEYSFVDNSTLPVVFIGERQATVDLLPPPEPKEHTVEEKDFG